MNSQNKLHCQYNCWPFSYDTCSYLADDASSSDSGDDVDEVDEAGEMFGLRAAR